MKDKVLKNYNREMNMLMLVNILLFIIIGYGLNDITDNSNIIKLIFMILIPGLPSLIITNVIPVDFKESLILDEKYSKEPILTLMKKED